MKPTLAAFRVLPLFLLLGTTANAQAPLNTMGSPLVIDLSNTAPGVNNGLFGADAEMGSTTPAAGQLDLNAWDYFYDGTTAEATGNAAAFPGTLPQGSGVSVGGNMATGVNAVDVDGSRCIGIQPTGSHFTSGSITLRAVNNTGSAITQVAVAYTVHVLNDRERSNRFGFLYSVDNSAGSYLAVDAAAVASPDVADSAWSSHPIAFTVPGIQVEPGAFLYLRWYGEDISGSGQRDEFALTDIRITPQQTTGPALTASTTGLPAFTQELGTASSAQLFTISGSDLSGEVSIVVPAPFGISLSENGNFVQQIELDPTAGALPTTTVYVRLNSSTAGPWTAAATITSPGANTLTINLSGATTSPDVPTLFLNELLASNTTGITDEYGEHDDWFEVYNPNGFDVDLAGWYVSDDPAQITRYRFDPDGSDAVVPAFGWLLIWADNQTAQGNLHTNFALSTNGEDILLTAPDGATIVDQITFGVQTADVSYGRAMDGQEPWIAFTVPTPGASNQGTGVDERMAVLPLRAWPNPVQDGTLFTDRVISGTLCSLEGRVLARVHRTNTVDISMLGAGTYVLRTLDGSALRFVKY